MLGEMAMILKDYHGSIETWKHGELFCAIGAEILSMPSGFRASVVIFSGNRTIP